MKFKVFAGVDLSDFDEVKDIIEAPDEETALNVAREYALEIYAQFCGMGDMPDYEDIMEEYAENLGIDVSDLQMNDEYEEQYQKACAEFDEIREEYLYYSVSQI